jgi:hypothetical protein
VLKLVSEVLGQCGVSAWLASEVVRAAILPAPVGAGVSSTVRVLLDWCCHSPVLPACAVFSSEPVSICICTIDEQLRTSSWIRWPLSLLLILPLATAAALASAPGGDRLYHRSKCRRRRRRRVTPALPLRHSEAARPICQRAALCRFRFHLQEASAVSFLLVPWWIAAGPL